MSVYATGESDDRGNAGIAIEPAVLHFSIRVVDGIQWHDWVAGCNVSLEDARAAVATSRAIADGAPIHIISDLRAIHGISREARAYFTNQGVGMKVALLVHSPLSRVIANFAIALSHGITIKAFTDPDAAVAWHRQKSRPPQ